MLHLIKKELTANLRYMVSGLAIFVIYMFVFSSTDVVLFMMCLMISFYTICTTNLILDERYKIDLLMSALPVRRKDIVISKYLLVLVIYIASFLLYTFLGVVSRAAGFDKIPSLNLVSASLGFLAISVFNGITLPLAFKFGAQATRFVSFILFFILFFLGSFFGKLGLNITAATLTQLNNVQFSLFLLAIALIINIISYMIAKPIYEGKDF